MRAPLFTSRRCLSCGPHAVLLAVLVVLLPSSLAWGQYVSPDTNAVWHPVLVRSANLGNVNNVTLHSSEAFWYPRVTTVRDVGLNSSWPLVQWAILDAESATTPTHPGSSELFSEGNLWKLTEAATYILAQWPSQADNPIQMSGQPFVPSYGTLANRLTVHAAKLRAAQTSYGARKPDHNGYMHVRVMNRDPNIAPPSGETAVDWHPWENRYGQGDDYTMGYVLMACAAHYESTGNSDPTYLNIGRDAAIDMYNYFIGGGRVGTGSDGDIECGLLEIYRCTGDSRIRDIANYFIAQRGHNANGDPSPTLRLYFQDDVPIEQQQAINGHAGRAVSFYSGVANAALLGRTDWYNPLYRVWRSDTKRKMYVTGTIGGWDTTNNGEAFSQSDYELVNDKTANGAGAGSYCESCASCDQAAFDWRMARLKGDGDSIDELERTLYNGVAHGLSADGTHSYYQNPLHDQDNPRYNAWVCCPPNLLRTTAGIGRYIYGRNNNDIWINLFIASDATIPLTNGNVPVSLRTNQYPWDGRITITVTPSTPTNFAMHLRMPGWCRNAMLRLNGKVISKPVISNRYIVINRTWSSGDQIVFNMAMPIMRIESHPSVQANTGCVCIQRGPIIFGIEGVDNGGGSPPNAVISATPNLQGSFNAGLLGGVEVITANKQGGGTLNFIPWYAMAQRASSWQRVWIKQENKTVRTTGWGDLLYREYTP